MVVAPKFDNNATKILKLKKNLILLKIPNYKNKINDYRSTLFGDLYQTRDTKPINTKFINLVTTRKQLQNQFKT